MASLKAQSLKAKGNQQARNQPCAGKGRGLKGPGVTAVTLETGRSNLGQGEARRKPGGGPKRY